MPNPDKCNQPSTKATSPSIPRPPPYPLTLLHQTAQSRFAEIAEAYEILSEESSRQLYDHARRVRAAHDEANANRDGDGAFGGGWGTAHWEMDPEWYYADGMDLGGFGSSFSGSAAGGGGGGFGAAFGFDPFAAGGGGGRQVFEFRLSDPVDVFEVCCVWCVCCVLCPLWS